MRTGFPEQARNKVINALLDKKISYKIFENVQVIEEKDFKKLNNYDKYLSKGILKYNNKAKFAYLNDKINVLNETKLNGLLDIIEKYASKYVILQTILTLLLEQFCSSF